jgi:hypothetical protein
MKSENYSLHEMLAYACPDQPSATARRVKRLESLLAMKDIEISLLRRDVSRLRAVIRKRANLN